MTLPPYFAAALRLLLSLKGRSGRSAYWGGVAVICLTVYISVLAGGGTLSLLLDLCVLWFIFAVGVKRFQDFGWDIWRFCAVLVAGTIAAKIWDYLTPATPEYVTDIIIAVIAMAVTGAIKGKTIPAA